MNPLLLDIPDAFTSDRLLLRCPRAGDGETFFASVRDSLAELKPWLPWAREDFSLEDAEDSCRRAAANYLTRVSLQHLIFSRQDGRHLGCIWADQFNWKIPACEIGYWLCTRESGRGLMLEAVLTLKGMLREKLGMRRMEIRTVATNQRSRHVAQRAGFQLEGILRQSAVIVGPEVRDVCIFAWIDEDAAGPPSPP